jgi:hypothetical protein
MQTPARRVQVIADCAIFPEGAGEKNCNVLHIEILSTNLFFFKLLI